MINWRDTMIAEIIEKKLYYLKLQIFNKFHMILSIMQAFMVVLSLDTKTKQVQHHGFNVCVLQRVLADK